MTSLDRLFADQQAVSKEALRAGLIPTVANYLELQQMPLPVHSHTTVFVRGREDAGDGGEGFFVWKSAEIAQANGGTTIASDASPTGLWARTNFRVCDVRWFGARGDGSADDTEAFERALSYVAENEKALFVPNGVYRLVRSLRLPQSFRRPNILGENRAETILRYEGDNASILICKGGSGFLSGSRIENLHFQTSGQNVVGIEFEDQCGVTVLHCRFDESLDCGALFRNTQGFTEYCVLEHCDFHSKVSARYKRDNDQRSFHGCGLLHSQINIGAGRTAIEIGPGCLPYNAPLTATVWTTGANTRIVSNQSGLLAPEWPNFHGHLNLEAFEVPNVAGMPTFVAGGPLAFVGSISSMGGFRMGEAELTKLYITRGPIGGNTQQLLAEPSSRRQQILAAETTIENVERFASAHFQLNFLAAGYDYRCAFRASHHGFGGQGIVSGLEVILDQRSNGWAAPTFSVLANGDVRVRCNDFSNGVQVDTHQEPLGWHAVSQSPYLGPWD